MKKASFTLMEILVGMVILSILATLGFSQYQTIIEGEKAKICAVNLDVLQSALDIYIMEHDAIPASLSEIPGEYLSRAYAQILQREGAWRIKLAYFIVGWEEKGLAYAQTTLSLKDDLAKGNIQLLSCPKDSNSLLKPGGGGTRSYALNSGLKNLTVAQYMALSDETVTLGDCKDNEIDTGLLNLNEVHKLQGEDLSITITKKRKICQRKNGVCKQEVRLGAGSGCKKEDD
jgi:prepilin-type N-terminal cleavage/methylation domain-containing protein